MNTVKAARALTRRYDAELRPFGVTVAQFTVLMQVRFGKAESLSAMAESIAMDRTTLSRNIDLLVRKGLVRKSTQAGGSARVCVLTAEAESLTEDLIPKWYEAQAEMRRLLNGIDVDNYLKTLRLLING